MEERQENGQQPKPNDTEKIKTHEGFHFKARGIHAQGRL
jgi:hypothetical protein